jgi:hypothetical protein
MRLQDDYHLMSLTLKEMTAVEIIFCVIVTLIAKNTIKAWLEMGEIDEMAR